MSPIPHFRLLFLLTPAQITQVVWVLLTMLIFIKGTDFFPFSTTSLGISIHRLLCSSVFLGKELQTATSLKIGTPGRGEKLLGRRDP